MYFNSLKGEYLDGELFISEVEKSLIPIAPILEFAIKKQLADVGASRDALTVEQAIEFVNRMTNAMELFLGKDEAYKARKIMTSALRKCAPEYFEGHALI